jgi:hypothetical protein
LSFTTARTRRRRRDHQFEEYIMSRFEARLSLFAGAMALACQATHADVITDWNVTALAATEPLSPQAEYRVLAMTHAAMFDAVNAITRSHTPFIVQPQAPPESSVEAAAASAAHGVLLGLFPHARRRSTAR